MAKRSADKELTHDNWDQEQEEEEPGVFRVANKDVLEKREIRTAKRRGVTDDKSGAGAFKGFSFGLSTTTPGGLGSKPFPFTTQPKSTTSESTTKPALGGITSGESTTESQYRRSLRTLNESVLRWIDDHIKTNPYCILTPVFNDYEKYIKELDRDFPPSSDKVVGKTPVATNAAATGFSFSPSSVVASSTVITSSCSSGVSSSQTSTSAAVSAALFSFGTATTNSEGKPFAAPTSSTGVVTGFSFAAQDSKASTGFSFGAQPSKGTTSVASGFCFGAVASKDSATSQSSKEATSASAFKFGAPPSKEETFTGSGFSFSVQPTKEATSTPVSGFSFSFQPTKEAPSSSASDGASTSAGDGASTSASNEGGDDENYVPPKTEVVDIKEDDAFYTIRCKLYFKINNEFKERGLGNLYLKPCGEKTQLLVRAGTNLGNILLNIQLSKNIPTSRQGNNVTMVCPPNPPLDDKKPEDKEPVCMLIRVKKEEDAEKLLKQINDHKV